MKYNNYDDNTMVYISNYYQIICQITNQPIMNQFQSNLQPYDRHLSTEIQTNYELLFQ